MPLTHPTRTIGLATADPERADRQAMIRYGGIGAVLAGVVFLLTVVYTFGFLASLGLTVELLDAPAQLLPWINAHTGAYMGLWGIFVLSLLCLFPAPLALAEVAGRGRAATRIATAAGLAGVVVGLAGAMVNAATAPALGAASRTVSPALLPNVILLSELMGSLGLHLRLLSDLLIALWLGLTGVALVRHAARPMLGRAQVAVAALTIVVVIAKALYWADWEPFIGPVLALMYLGLGVSLLRRPTLAVAGAATG